MLRQALHDATCVHVTCVTAGVLLQTAVTNVGRCCCRRYTTLHDVTGEVLLQTDDYNNLTLKGGNWTYDMPAVEGLLQQLSKEQKAKKRVTACNRV